jgi:hypothetical protein
VVIDQLPLFGDLLTHVVLDPGNLPLLTIRVGVPGLRTLAA